MINTYEVTDREVKFKKIDKSRLVYLGYNRMYRVFKCIDGGHYWVTCGGDYVSHHIENPLQRN